MGRNLAFRLPAFAMLGLLSVGVTWTRAQSTVYPYSILQPSSFRHVVLYNTQGRPVDFFSPSLGSASTSVTVVALSGRTPANEIQILRGRGGKNAHVSESMSIAGQRVKLVGADFHGMIGRFTVEQCSFVSQGMVWTLTASYDSKYRKLRPTMMRMIRSFQARAQGARRR